MDTIFIYSIGKMDIEKMVAFFDGYLEAYDISKVQNTVERIKYIRNIEKEIKEALNSRLPEIKADIV